MPASEASAALRERAVAFAENIEIEVLYDAPNPSEADTSKDAAKSP